MEFVILASVPYKAQGDRDFVKLRLDRAPPAGLRRRVVSSVPPGSTWALADSAE